MHRITTLLMLLSLLGIAVINSGCTAYNVAVEERNVGTYANDEKIALTIEKDFLADDLVKYLDFDASCYKGNVYVIGEYESRAQVNQAINIAKSIKGVKTVTTYLLPKLANDTCGTTDALDLYAQLKNKLVADQSIWSTNVEIKTVQCHLVLLGVVNSEATKDKIIAYANQIQGARSVKSFLLVSPD